MKKSGKGKSPSNIAPGSLQAQINTIRRKKQSEGSASMGHFLVPPPISTYVPPEATLHIHSDTDQEETPCNTEVETTEVEPEAETGTETEPEVQQAAMRRRGRNKNVALNKLTSGGEKIRILFNKETGKPFSDEAKLWSRHIGLLVTQDNILPHCTESWRKLTPATLEALWQAVIDKFDAEDIHLYRDATLRQMRARWEDWRHRMNKEFVRPFDNDIPRMRENGPPNMNNANWNWLLDHYYLIENYKKKSATNRENKSKLKYAHRTGSQPYSVALHDMEVELGQPPKYEEFFRRTRMNKHTNQLDPSDQEKYDIMRSKREEDPNIGNVPLAEWTFGDQSHGTVIGMGPILASTLRQPSSSKRQLREENSDLRKQISQLESSTTTKIEMEQRLRAEMEQREARIQEQMQAMMNRVLQSQGHPSQPFQMYMPGSSSAANLDDEEDRNDDDDDDNDDDDLT